MAERKKLLQQEPRVIERYMRLRMHINGRWLSRFILRRILLFKERKRERALASTLAEYAKQAAKSQSYGYEASAAIFNLGLFFLIAERDIQSVKIDALTHPDPWKRSLCARIILLTIHELDMDKVAGAKLRTALENAGVPVEVKRQAVRAMRAVRNAQQKAQKQFAFLRNATIAHRDANSLLQYRSITLIDEMEVIKIAGEFYDGTRLFLNILPTLVLHVGTAAGLLNQLMARSIKAADTKNS